MSSPENIIGLLISVSIASERLVEIIKGVIPWLNSEHADVSKEGWRRSVLQCLAVLSGILTAMLARPIIAPMIDPEWNGYIGILAIGLLASGGSGFWNAILSYVLQVKEIKKAEVKQAQLTSQAIVLSSDAHPNLNLGQEQMTSNECYDVPEK
jgi:hypothetical protein